MNRRDYAPIHFAFVVRHGVLKAILFHFSNSTHLFQVGGFAVGGKSAALLLGKANCGRVFGSYTPFSGKNSK